MRIIHDRGLEYRIESLTRAQETVIAHGCNDVGKMGAGVALAIKKMWPEAFRVYEAEVAEFSPSIGSVIWAPIRADSNLFSEQVPDKWIANVISQSGYGHDGVRRASYDGIDRGLRQVARRATDEFLTRDIATSMIGASLGGASWPVVREIMLSIQHDFDVRFLVYNTSEADVIDRLEPW